MQIVVEDIIRAPRAIAFANATDVRNWPAMITSISETEILTREPIGAGTRVRETRRMYGRPSTAELTFQEFEPPEHFVLAGENNGAFYRILHNFTDVSEGTRLTLTFVVEPQSLSAQLMTPLALMFRGTLRRQIASDLSDLKRAIETRTR